MDKISVTSNRFKRLHWKTWIEILSHADSSNGPWMIDALSKNRKAFWIVKYAPFAFILNILSIICSVRLTSPNGFKTETPAFANTTWTFSGSWFSFYILSMSSQLATSAWIPWSNRTPLIDLYYLFNHCTSSSYVTKYSLLNK